MILFRNLFGGSPVTPFPGSPPTAGLPFPLAEPVPPFFPPQYSRFPFLPRLHPFIRPNHDMQASFKYIGRLLNCPRIKLSAYQTVLVSNYPHINCPRIKLSSYQTAHVSNCPCIKLLSLKTVLGSNCPRIKLSSYQTVLVSNYPRINCTRRKLSLH